MNGTAFLSSPALLLVCRLVLGLVFIIAAVPKAADPGAFAAAIEAYELLPVPAVNAAAILIAWVELVCGVLLVAGAYRRSSALLLGALLAVFIVAIAAAVLRGLNINCGCFGSGDTTQVGWGRVVEDLALLLPAWLIFRSKGSGQSGGRGEPGGRSESGGRGEPGGGAVR